MVNDRIQHTKEERRRRLGAGLERNYKLFVPENKKDPNFEYRWINDSPGRIEQYTTQDDWDIVTTDRNGEPFECSRPVGPGPDGRPLYAKLCRKRKEYYDQDKEEELKSIKAQEDAMRVGPPPSPQGLGAEPATTYVPGGRNTITKS
jgi:hypothetical protein